MCIHARTQAVGREWLLMSWLLARMTFADWVARQKSPRTEKIRLELITTAKICNKFSLESPYHDIKHVSRESPKYETSTYTQLYMYIYISLNIHIYIYKSPYTYMYVQKIHVNLMTLHIPSPASGVSTQSISWSTRPGSRNWLSIRRCWSKDFFRSWSASLLKSLTIACIWRSRDTENSSCRHSVQKHGNV